jgi:endonuclease III related protein
LRGMDTHTRQLLLNLYQNMLAAFGHRHWWPADSPFEVCAGAVLTQNTAWKNVAKAIANLKQAGALDAFTIYHSSHEQLAGWIKPAGYFNVKALRLRNFVNHLVERHGGSMDSLFAAEIEPLREELLSIKGIGKETADSMILYAADKPIFVVDAYTKRVLNSHGLMPQGSGDYDSIQALFHRNLPREVPLYNDFHAQLVAVGHHYCKRRPLCGQCPLSQFLPEGGPIIS